MNRREMTKLLALAMGGTVSPGCCWFGSDCEIDPGPGPSRPLSQSLSVPFIAQQTQVWCWAAVSEMVLRYYGTSVQQCAILARWTGAPCCAVGLSVCITAAPDLVFIQQTLLEAGGVRSLRAGPLSAVQVRQELDAGRPFIIGYRGSFSGHVVVVAGYQANSDGSNLRLDIHDPFYGPFRQIPFGTTFTYGGQSVWSETLIGLAR